MVGQHVGKQMERGKCHQLVLLILPLVLRENVSMSIKAVDQTGLYCYIEMHRIKSTDKALEK